MLRSSILGLGSKRSKQENKCSKVVLMEFFFFIFAKYQDFCDCEKTCIDTQTNSKAAVGISSNITM